MNNFINRLLLWCFLLPTGVYRRFGADIPQLKAILITKLTIDDRTVTGLFAASNRNKEGGSNLATVITMVLAFVMGLLFTFVFAIDDDLSRLTVYFSIYGFMLAMFLITDFSHILIDVKDNFIILPKPVSSQTFLMARLIHIIIHVSKIVIPLGLPAWIATCISRGLWGAFVFIPIIFLLTMLTFTLVNAVYLLIMRVFPPSKINSLITSLQIGFTVLLYGGFQILSRAMGETFLEHIDITKYAWIWIFPSFWMAAGWKYLFTFSPDTINIIGIVLSILVPLFSLWIMVKYLAPAFFRKLSMISAGTESVEKQPDQKSKHKPEVGWSLWFSKLFTKQGVESEAFGFVWKMTGRSREFKLKVYPQIGYILVLVVISQFAGNDIWTLDDFGQIPDKTKLRMLVFLYLSCIIYISALVQMPYHSKPKSAWIYYSPPLTRPGEVISAGIRVCLVKFFLPVVLILSIAAVTLLGPMIIPNLLFGFGNVYLACVLYAWLVMDRLPFSVSLHMAQEGMSAFRNFFMLLFLPILGFPHYFLFDSPLALSIGGLITTTTAYFVLRNTRKISWEYLKEG